MSGAGTNPDHTPRTHAAPGPGWAGSYDDPELWQVHENSVVIHSADFGALEPRITSPNGLAQPDVDQWSANEAGENVLEPVTGQLQYMGGRDTTQGYSLRNRYGFDAGAPAADNAVGAGDQCVCRFGRAAVHRAAGVRIIRAYRCRPGP